MTPAELKALDAAALPALIRLWEAAEQLMEEADIEDDGLGFKDNVAAALRELREMKL